MIRPFANDLNHVAKRDTQVQFIFTRDPDHLQEPALCKDDRLFLLFIQTFMDIKFEFFYHHSSGLVFMGQLQIGENEDIDGNGDDEAGVGNDQFQGE